MVIKRAFDLPNDIGFLPPIAPPAPRIVYMMTPISRRIGARDIINCLTKLSLAGGVAWTETPLFKRSPINPRSPGLYVLNFSPSEVTPLMLLPAIVTLETLPCLTF